MLPEGPEIVDEVLARLRSGPVVSRQDLRGTGNLGGGSGGQAGYFLEVGDYFAKANSTRRYASVDLACSHDLPVEELRRSLGIYHSSRIWFLTQSVDDCIWACSLTRKMISLREIFNRPPAGSDPLAWQFFLDGLWMSLDLGRRAEVMLDCNPNNFGLDGDQLWYLDDDLLTSKTSMLGLQAVLRLREYEGCDWRVRKTFLDGFLQLVRSCSGDERRRWSLTREAIFGLISLRDAKLRAMLDDFFGPPS